MAQNFLIDHDTIVKKITEKFVPFGKFSQNLELKIKFSLGPFLVTRPYFRRLGNC